MKKTLQEFDFTTRPSTGSIIQTLKSDGVLVLKNFCAPELLERLKKEFTEILSGQHSNNEWFENRPYSLGKAALISKGKEMNKHFGAAHEFFSQPLMQDITVKYMGERFHANQKIFVVKDIVGTSHHANDLHFDVQRTLKFFLYLTDTTAVNGAFRCVPGSNKVTGEIREKNAGNISYGNREFTRQLPFTSEDTVSVDGKAGSLIIFDTDVFHQAGKVSEGERWVMRGQTEADLPAVKPPTLIKRILGKFK